MKTVCKHILLSSVGINGPKKTSYAGEHSPAVTANFSAFGLWQLLPKERRPDEVWFLLTPKAHENAWSAIVTEAKSLNLTVKSIDLAGDMDDTRDFLEQTAHIIPENCRLTLNVTEGLRHHAFLFYALALYLTSFRGVMLEGAWYCRLETNERDDPKPLIDLKPTLELAHWFHALAVFRETGQPGTMADLIAQEMGEIHKTAKLRKDTSLQQRASKLKPYVNAFNEFAFANSSGLPLELGKVAHWVARDIDQFARTEMGQRLPLASHLSRLIQLQAETVAFNQGPPSKGVWKKSIELNERERHRQATMIDAYLEREQFSLAIGLMREWVISWLMWRGGRTTNWLGYPERKSFEQRLGGMLALIRDDESPVGIDLTDDQHAFARFWSQVSDSLRNTFHHHGMREESLKKPTSLIDEVREFWDRLKEDQIMPPQFGGGKGKLLICPIGKTPGVLYSALQHVNPTPDRLLVVCSGESATAIEQAIEQAEVFQVEVLRLEMQNAFAGFDEFGPLIDTASRWLFEADEIHANLTGGTTLMGVLVGQLLERAGREYQRPVRKFILIDKRSPEEQRSDPWQLGEIHYLDDSPQDEQGNESNTETAEDTKP